MDQAQRSRTRPAAQLKPICRQTYRRATLTKKMIQFTDDVAAEIAATIGSRKPETGGALFGPKNSNLISMIAFDEAAHTTSVSYTPSKELIASIPEIEAAEGVEFKGIIHSHPRGVTQPSGRITLPMHAR